MGATTVSVTADDGESGAAAGMRTRDIAVTVVETGILAFDAATGSTAVTAITTTEDAAIANFYVQLTSQPTHDVTVSGNE